MAPVYVIRIEAINGKYVLCESPNRMDYDVRKEDDLYIRPMIFFNKDELAHWYKANEDRILDKMRDSSNRASYITVRMQSMELSGHTVEELGNYQWEDE